MDIFTKSITKGETNKLVRLVDLFRVKSFVEHKTINGFSLMEMMVVMLVVALVLAISTPMITKRHAADGLNREVWDILGDKRVTKKDSIHIGWNKDTKNISAIIGGGQSDTTKYSDKPGLIIKTSDNRPHIAFMYADQPKGTMDMISGIAIGYKPKASATNSIAIGNQANVTSTGTNATAIGAKAKASEADAFAYGSEATADKTNSIAIGYKARASGKNAIGISANALGENSVALGWSANTSGSTAATAIGYEAKTTNSKQAVAIGNKVQLNNSSDTVALGNGITSAKGANSVFIGSGVTTDSDSANSVIIGNAKGSGNNALAIGSGSIVAGDATALGANANAASNGIAIGYSANASRFGGVALGYSTQASTDSIGFLGATGGGNSIALGYNAIASNNTIAIGKDATGDQANTVIIGPNTKVYGNNSVVLGTGAVTSPPFDTWGAHHSVTLGNIHSIASNSVVMGQNAQGGAQGLGGNGVAIGPSAHLSRHNGIAIGPSARVDGYSFNGIALGNDASMYENNGTAIGKGSLLQGENSTAIGYHSTAQGRNSVVIGNAFVAKLVTGGSPQYYARDNAIVIGNANSIVYIPGKLEVEGLDTPTGNVHLKGSMFIDNHLIVKKGAALGVDVAGGKWGSAAANEAFVAIKHWRNKNYTAHVMTTSGGDWKVDQTLTCFEVMDMYGLSNVFKDGSSSACYSSDIRLKDIIGENLDAMDKINRLKVYNYTYKSDTQKVKRVGVIAQDLQKIFPNAVVTDENGYLSIRHEDMFYAMVNALKELDAKIKKITKDLANNIKLATSNAARIKAKDKEMKQLKAEVAELRKMLEEALK